MSGPLLDIHPTPQPDEAAAIAAAIGVLLTSGSTTPVDPRPPSYRSAWRRAAIHEAAGLAADPRRIS